MAKTERQSMKCLKAVRPYHAFTIILLLTLYLRSTYGYQPITAISVNFTTSSQYIYKHEIQNNSTNLSLFLLIIDGATLNYVRIMKYDIANNYSSLQSTYEITYAYTYNRIDLVLLNNSVMLVYGKTANSSDNRRVLLNKNNLIYQYEVVIPTFRTGRYLPKWGLAYINQVGGLNQYLYSDLESGTGLIQNTRAAITQVALLEYAPDQSSCMVVYSTTGTHGIRTFSSTSQMITSFSSLSSDLDLCSGYQTYCFSQDSSQLYKLCSNGEIETQTILLGLWLPVVLSTSITNATGCYTDPATNTLIFYKNSPSTITFYTYSTNNWASSPPFSASWTNLTKDLSSRYLSMVSTSSNNIITANLVSNVTCMADPNIFLNVVTGLCQICPIAGCLTCISYRLCGVCDGGFNLTTGLQCINASIVVIANATANITANITANTTANLTNTTANTTSNTTSLNESMLWNGSLAMQKVSSSGYLFDYTFNNSIFSVINRIPGSRKIFSVIFYFFSCFDDFWLYQYHSTDYRPFFNNIFTTINTIQNQKYTLIGANHIYQVFQNWYNTVDTIFDTKISYTDTQFISTSSHGEGFLVNAFTFLIVQLPASILICILCRILFELLFRWRWSIFVRIFAFNGYILPLLFDGNIQYFSFLLFSQHKMGFSLNFNQLLVNTLQYFVLFVLTIYSFGGFYLFYFFYKKNTTYFIENGKANLYSVSFFTLQVSARNFILGGVHNFLRYNLYLRMLVLIWIDLILAFISIYFLFKDKKALTFRKIFKKHIRIWIWIFFSFIRVIINLVLYFQTQENQNQNYYQTILTVLFEVYTFIYLLAVFHQICSFISEKISTLMKKQKNIQNKIQKSIENTNQAKDQRQIKKIKTIFEKKIQNSNVIFHYDISKDKKWKLIESNRMTEDIFMKKAKLKGIIPISKEKFEQNRQSFKTKSKEEIENEEPLQIRKKSATEDYTPSKFVPQGRSVTKPEAPSKNSSASTMCETTSIISFRKNEKKNQKIKKTKEQRISGFQIIFQNQKREGNQVKFEINAENKKTVNNSEKIRFN